MKEKKILATSLLRGVIAKITEGSTASNIFRCLTVSRRMVNTGTCTWHDLGTAEEALMSILAVAQRREVIQEVSGLIHSHTTDPGELWVIYEAVVLHNISCDELPGVSEEVFDQALERAESSLED